MKARPLLLFAPGAGAGSDSDWMRAWAERLSSLGRVVAFDYDYRREGRRAPDRLPRLLSAHRAALEAARQGHRGPVVLVGKSMGGRVGCHLALETPVDAVVALGYPLVGVRRRDGSQPVRGEVLEALEVPLLLVQGSRDRLFPMERWAEQAPRLKTPCTRSSTATTRCSCRRRWRGGAGRPRPRWTRRSWPRSPPIWIGTWAGRRGAELQSRARSPRNSR